MQTVLTAFATFFADRREALSSRGEEGNLVEWLILAVMAIVVVVFMIPGVKDLASRVLDFIGAQLGV